MKSAGPLASPCRAAERRRSIETSMADLCVECGRFVPRACRDIVTAFTCPYDLFSVTPSRDDGGARTERDLGDGVRPSATGNIPPSQFGIPPD